MLAFWGLQEYIWIQENLSRRIPPAEPPYSAVWLGGWSDKPCIIYHCRLPTLYIGQLGAGRLYGPICPPSARVPHLSGRGSCATGRAAVTPRSNSSGWRPGSVCLTDRISPGPVGGSYVPMGPRLWCSEPAWRIAELWPPRITHPECRTPPAFELGWFRRAWLPAPRTSECSFCTLRSGSWVPNTGRTP